MRDYELLYIASGELTEDKVTTVTDAVNEFLVKQGGKVANENLWGRRRLAYGIAKQDHGWYVVTRFSLAPDKLADLQGTLRLNQQVARFLILQASEVPTEEEAAKALEAVSASEAEDKEAAESANQPTAKTPSAKPKEPAKPKPAAKPKPETAVEAKERKAKLDEKLGEILKES